MARARNIKPGFFKNPELVELPFECRLLFIGLWMLADREGRLECSPKKIRMEIFPADDVDVGTALHALAGKNLIVMYEVEGASLVWIPTFTKHQKPHPKEIASAIPPYLGLVSGGMQDLFSTASPGKVVASPALSSFPSLSLNPSTSTSGGARATRLPADWQATAEQIDWALANQPTWTREHAVEVAATFRDHWLAKSGRDATKLDWVLTWRNWVRREGAMRAHRSGSASVAERNRALREEVARETSHEEN